MDVKLAVSAQTTSKTDALIVLAIEGIRRADLEKPLSAAWDSGEITGKFLDFSLFHSVEGVPALRVLIAGAGKTGKLTPPLMAKLAGAAIRFLKGKGVRKASLLLDAEFAAADFVEAAARGAVTSVWEPDGLKTVRDDLPRNVQELTIVVPLASPDLEA